MLEQARHRVQANAWKNVALIEGAAEEAEIPAGVDAVLFSLTHDILQSDQALKNIFANTSPGARVGAYGPKWAPRWALPVDWGVRLVASKFVTTFQGFDRPLAKLERYFAAILERVAATRFMQKPDPVRRSPSYVDAVEKLARGELFENGCLI